MCFLCKQLFAEDAARRLVYRLSIKHYTMVMDKKKPCVLSVLCIVV